MDVYNLLIEEDSLTRTINLNLISTDKTNTILEVKVTRVNPLSEQSGQVIVLRDVSLEQELTDELTYQATHDNLTGLYNRMAFENQVKTALVDNISNHREHTALYLDLDHFKLVNDTCGHLTGDEMLKLIAHLLTDNIRKHDTLERATELGQKLCLAVKDFRFLWDDKIFSIDVSIGISAITQDSKSVQQILSDIDSACYIAKEKGRNRVHVIEPDDTETTQRHGEMRWVSEIRSALEDDRLILYKQVIMPSVPSAADQQHFEILILMQDKDGSIIMPGAFLPAAERYNLMLEIDFWVIKNSFKAIASHSITGSEQVCICSINLSGQSIGETSLYDFIINQQKHYRINPQHICFEITESAAITHLEQAIDFIHKLNSKGFLFALDDFDTCMSSFAYFKNLPVNYLKIDGSFIKDILEDPIDRAIVKSINAIGHIMGLQTIAEYVENDAIKNELIAMQIDYLQGYGITRPESL